MEYKSKKYDNIGKNTAAVAAFKCIKEEEEEPLQICFDHIYVHPNDIPKCAKIFYCQKHILPWCVEYELPCYHCTCQWCKELPEKYRKPPDDPECEECRPDEYNYDHSDEEYYLQ